VSLTSSATIYSAKRNKIEGAPNFPSPSTACQYICSFMGQKKLVRFAAIRTFGNVFEYPENMQGQWSNHFGNANPITLELACGKGEYAVGLGAMHPNRNFIGVDLKGNRIFVGAKKALADGLTNVAFMRTQIDKLNEYFAADEVQQVWLTFPDPQLRRSKHKKRLTNPKFLRLYQQICANCVVHLKTDSPVLYNYTKMIIDMYGLEVKQDIADIHAAAVENPELLIKTHYEGLDIAQSNRIHYLQFTLPKQMLDLNEEQIKNWVYENENNEEAT
jgi:tRNA (guanine-N7-)-methyltransferase